tara:strand:+ start:781 stop:2586 length:1806 start_codon:yes stop_codon:yes gene_type:complete
MKKIFTLALLGFGLGAYAQLPVSQTAEKKKVVLEEFTGKTCGYCPAGHKIADEMKAADPDNVFIINIHAGSYASGTPNYRTTVGPALANLSELEGYPAGTINRKNFPGFEQTDNTNTPVSGITAMGRGNWAGRATAIKTEDAYVNIAAEASVDLNTRLLTVDVEAYYTGNAPTTSNFINVALTQSGIKGPQSGGSSFYPEMIDGNGDYTHNKMVRHLLTGQWGDEITTVSTGDLVQETYTYTLPATIGDVDVDLTKLNVVVFVAETHQNIINGNEATPSLTGLTENLEAQVMSAVTPETSCSASFDPEVNIRNWGNTTITSMKIEFSANDLAAQTFDWTGNLLGGLTANIVLPTLSYNSQSSNDILIKVIEVNGGADDILTNNEVTAIVLEVPEYQTQTMTLEFTTDQYASETSWKLYNAAGTVVQENGALVNATLYTETLTLTENDCYTFEFIDSYGDGLTGSGPGTISLDFGGTNVLAGSGSFSKISTGFATVDANGNGNGNPTDNVDTTASGILDVELVSNFSIFPNPTKDIVNVIIKTNNNVAVQVELLDVLGRTVLNAELNNGVASFNVSKLNKGIYIVSATSQGKAIATTSLVVN